MSRLTDTDQKTKHFTLCALFAAFAMILSYVEAILPIPLLIPGAKIGLANAAVLLALYRLGIAEAVVVNLVRILVTGFLFGNIYTISFALAGAVLSLIVMALFHFFGFHMVTASMAGGISHNIGQFLVALVLVLHQGLWYYLPLLAVAGLVSGLVIGIVDAMIDVRVKELHI